MKLDSVHMERFGTRTGLQLDPLSDKLNVVFGGQGSGKKTVFQFISWMLFGGHDDLGPRPSLNGHRTAGALEVIDGQHRRRRVIRSHDVGQPDQVRVEGVDGVDQYPHRLTQIDRTEFHRVFCFGFDRTVHVDSLLHVARTFEDTVSNDEAPLQRLRELETRIQTLRLSHRNWHLEPLESLIQRRHQVESEISDVEMRRAEHVRQLQAEYEDVAQAVAEKRRQLGMFESVLHRLEAAIDQRRAQLENVAQQAQDVRERWLEARHQQVAEIDYQVQHWRDVLRSIRDRNERLATELSQVQLQPVLPPGTNAAELCVFLRSLGYHADDIERDLLDLDTGTVVGSEDETRNYLHSVLGAALSTMRDDVQRLTGELQRQQQNSLYHQRAGELSSLRRCEAELSSLIDTLNRRRETLSLSFEYEQVGEPLRDGCRNGNLRDSDEPSAKGHLNGTRHPVYDERSLSPMDRHRLADPVLEARLDHLLKRRDLLDERCRDLADAIAAEERRLEGLMDEQDRFDRQRLVTLQDELDRLVQQIRDVEQLGRARDEIAALERQADELRGHLKPNDFLRHASQMLSQLTDGAYLAIHAEDHREVWVEESRGRNCRYRELSHWGRDATYLSLMLALVASYRNRGVALPVMINDVFADTDGRRGVVVLDALAQFADQGHQIIVFTDRESTVQRLQAVHAQTFTLTSPDSLESRYARSESPVSEGYLLDRVVPTRTRSVESVGRAAHHDWVSKWELPRTNQAPLLTEATLLTSVDWLNPQHVDQLRVHTVETVAQLLAVSPRDGERMLERFHVTAATIYQWQSELSLQCFVGLTATDAMLLVACGIDDPEELAFSHVDDLHRRIGDYLVSRDTRNQFGSLARYERSRLTRWIQAAQRANDRRTVHRRPRMADGFTSVSPREPAEHVGLRQHERPRTDLHSLKGKRTVRAPQTPDISKPKSSKSAKPKQETLRFYLEPDDPVVDAPSIGPKTAERFHAIGVKTISELLDVDSASAAQQIGYRRINADLIRDWQLQTTLVCRIPNLRGHDAQILVACDVTTVEALAEMEVDTLLGQVTEFLTTSEGKRVLRNAKSPDLEEVSNWVRWAASSRELVTEK